MDKNLDNIVNRVRYFIDNKGISIRKFSRTIGVSHSLINNTKTLGSDKLEKILDKFQEISPEWLLTGKGEMLKTNDASNLVKDPEAVYGKVLEINPEPGKPNTLIADIKASAGFGSLLQDYKALEELPAISLPNAPFGLNIAFQIEGDSMHPTIRHLDFVAANKVNDVQDIRDGYTYIVVDKEEGVLCKRLYKLGQDFKIVSDNPIYPAYNRSHHKVHAIFKCFMRLSTDFRSYHDDVRANIQELRTEVSKIKEKVGL